MSALLFLASDRPFKELLNPHERIISINEAITLGIEIPDYASGLDRDKPILLYMDRDLHFNTKTKELEEVALTTDPLVHYCYKIKKD